MDNGEHRRKLTVELLEQAARLLDCVEYLLSKAVVAVGDETGTDRIYSLNCDAEELETAMREQIERMKRIGTLAT